ncbi:hypothetical protein B0H14DRAFT_3462927 [Mycena olivaceomarginata]|nr:hypothetical protein B0H14DRAFT_3462927 [Mycena olivaceomarginata]
MSVHASPPAGQSLKDPHHKHELPHQHLTQQQETAVCLAAVTPLPPSPTLSQEARDEVLADNIIASFARFINCNLYPMQLPATVK